MDKLWWSDNSSTTSSKAASDDGDRDAVLGLPLRSVGHGS
jgi:hypothetical protein